MNKLEEEAKEHGVEQRREAGKDRRKQERRKAKPGVNVRHSDGDYIHKRIRDQKSQS